jgi:hypothetical protein
VCSVADRAVFPHTQQDQLHAAAALAALLSGACRRLMQCVFGGLQWCYWNVARCRGWWCCKLLLCRCCLLFATNAPSVLHAGAGSPAALRHLCLLCHFCDQTASC